MQTFLLTSTYVQVTPEGAGVCVIQGTSGEVFLGNSAPSAGQAGIKLIDNWPIPVDVDKFPHVWVRGTGVARFAG